MNYERKLRHVSLLVLIAVFALSLAGSALAQTWTAFRPTGSPSLRDRFQTVLNYDAANNRLIAYFPGNPSVPPRLPMEVWVLTNANGLGGAPAWTRLQPTGPSPFANAAASVVYDAATNRLIVYGGCYANCSPALSEVFTLSNANGLGGAPVWSRIATVPAQERVSHSAVYDPTSNLMIAFGGGLAFYGTGQNDTRILSNPTESPATWNTLTTSGGLPGVREGHTAIYDEANNRMTIFGGAHLIRTCCPYDERDYNDVWVLSNANGVDGTPTWTQLTPLGTAPSPRTEHSAVYDLANNRMVIFGGTVWYNEIQGGPILGDVWQLTNANGLDPDPPTWSQIGQFGTPPGAKRVHGAVFDTDNQRMIVLGGVDLDGISNNWVWVLDLLTQ